MRSLKEFLLARYREDEDFQRWKRKFPGMFDFSEQVEVVEWEDEYAIADRNPEVIDEIRFWTMLAENGLVSWEEAQRQLRELPKLASKTMGIAFVEEKKVAFREKVPPLSIVIHELGHVYFEENDPVWNATYGGGEFLMWLIVRDYVKGNEESIRKWHSLLRLGYEDPEKLYEKLDEVALKVGRKLLGEDLSELRRVREFGLGAKYGRPIYELAMATGTLPSGDSPFPILVNALEGTRYGEVLWKKVLEELTSTEKPKAPRIRPPGR